MIDRETYCKDCDRSIYGKYHDCDINIKNNGLYVRGDSKCYCKIIDGKRSELYPWEEGNQNSDLIERQAAIDAILKETAYQSVRDLYEYAEDHSDKWCGGIVDAIDVVIGLPSARSERKTGKWIWDVNGMDWGLGAWCCSECGIKAETWWANDKRYNPLKCSGGNFCGNCGADMRGIQDEGVD